jgi:hypothetical protein
MDLNADERAVANQDTQCVGVFFEIEQEPNWCRFWLATGPVKVGTDGLDPNGTLYKGAGQIPNVPAVSHLFNGRAERFQITMSGISEEALGIAASEAAAVAGRTVRIGVGIFDNDWSRMLGGVRWFRSGIADGLTFKSSSASVDAPSVRSASLSVGSLMTGMRRGVHAFWSPQDQKRRYPGDKFCDNTPSFAERMQRFWPRW